jgi:16S rRNA C1402 N4-methylase RsmH
VIRKNRVDINKLKTIKFNNLVKTIIKIYILNKTVREFSNSRAKQEELNKLVDFLNQPPAILKTEGRFVLLIVSFKKVSVEVVKKLT